MDFIWILIYSYAPHCDPPPLLSSLSSGDAADSTEELVQLLLENGANPFSRNELGRANLSPAR